LSTSNRSANSAKLRPAASRYRFNTLLAMFLTPVALCAIYVRRTA
jgi:hypothetical protein